MTYVDVVIQSEKFGPWAYRTNVDVKCKTKVEELNELEKAFWESAKNAFEHLLDMRKNGELNEDEPEFRPIPQPPPDCETQNEPTGKQLRFARAISNRLGIPLPKVKTRQSLFIFIRDNRKKFDGMGTAETRTDPYDMEDEGWDYQEGLDYGDVSGADPWGVGE